MNYLAKAMMTIAGIIHVLPIPGVVGAAQLEKLYGLAFDEPNLVILMRHRAVLFGLLGVFLIYAALKDELAWIAIVGGIVSTATFVWLAWSVGNYNGAIARIVVADVVAVGCLGVAAVCQILSSQKS